jgi:AraC family transcriptional regulator
MPLCRDLKGVTAREAEFRSITSGHRLVSRRVGGFQLTETRHSAGSILQKHSHGDASVNFVIAGRLRETVGDVARRREYDCDAGSLLYKQPDEYHANVYGPEGARCLIIQPSAESLRALADAGHRADGNPFPLDPRPAQIAGRIYAEMRQSDDLALLTVEADVLALFSLLSRRSRRRSILPWIARARSYLADNSRQRIVLGDLARSLGVDPSELSRGFRRTYGVTASDFVRRERTRWAAARLSRDNDSLCEIALCAGFVDQSHFARTFHAHYGMTPRRYRRLTARA